MTFGIPVEACPLTLEGELKTANHLKWIKKRQVRDNAIRQTGVFNKIDMPGVNDVLVGRGKPFQQHPGNVRLRQLVELHVATYKAAETGEKGMVTLEILRTINDASGRFLKKDSDDWWVEVSWEDARVSE